MQSSIEILAPAGDAACLDAALAAALTPCISDSILALMRELEQPTSPEKTCPISCRRYMTKVGAVTDNQYLGLRP